MNRRITVSIETDWVFGHLNDEHLPAQLIADGLKAALGEKVRVLGCTFTDVSIEYDDAETDAGAVKDAVVGIFDTAFGSDARKDVLSFDERKTERNEDEADASKPETERGPEQSADTAGGETEAAVERRREEPEQNTIPDVRRRTRRERRGEREEHTEDKRPAAEAIAELVGGAQFKALAEELAQVIPAAIAADAADTVLRRAYLFSVNDGHGVTTYTTLLARLLKESGIAQFDDEPVREIVLPHDEREREDLLARLQRGCGGDKRVLLIDISDWLESIESTEFRAILRRIEAMTGTYLPVFRIPFVDKELLARVRYVLDDRMTVKDISFPPFSAEELRAIAAKRLSAHGFDADESAWAVFDQMVAEEKRDGRFYGVNTVDKIVREILYKKLLCPTPADAPDRVVHGAEIESLCEVVPDDRTGMAMLDALVGTDKIRDQILEIVTQIELSRRNPDVARPALHMRFVGNPGTGKTTVARIIGKILKERGVLSVGSFFECRGRDLCGRYVGETAPKTASICRDAYGSVLFIDEAYSLFRGQEGSNDYGREALDTLIAEMENHREDFVVIMAGYTDDMETMFRGNAGLSSRMPYKIEFPNFTRDQLADIYVKMLTGRDGQLLCAPDVPAAARAYFTGLGDDVLSAKDFGNARFVRNLVERAWAKAAMRCQLEGTETVLVTKDDFDNSLRDVESASASKKVGRIGFFG